MRFGLEVWIMAVQPVDTPVGFEVRVIQQAPDARSTHRPGAPLLRKGGNQVVKTPARGGAVIPGRFTGCHRHHIQTC